MVRTDNYLIQTQQAKQCFLTYDQDALIRKLSLKADENYLYATMFSQTYRICRKSGNAERSVDGSWMDANSHAEIMTLLDLICDSREDRHISGRFKSMQDFGHMFHQNLLENPQDPWAEKFQANPEGLRKVCVSLGGVPFPYGDIAYILEFFDGLLLLVQLWLGDEEFPASLRLLWDENALMYIKYETMHYAKNLILSRIAELM